MATSRRGFRRSHESVTNAVVASIVVTPNDAPTVVADSATQQFTGVLKNAGGVTIPLATGAVAWTVSDVLAGTISTGGLFTAGTSHTTYQVIATHTVSGVTKSVDVSVTA